MSSSETGKIKKSPLVLVTLIFGVVNLIVSLALLSSVQSLKSDIGENFNYLVELRSDVDQLSTPVSSIQTIQEKVSNICTALDGCY